MRGGLLSPSVQAVIKGEHLTVAQLLVPKEFGCKWKQGRGQEGRKELQA